MFRNREEAALQLVQRLQKYKNDPGVVLAVPRGAVPIACVIARELNLPLDIIMVKKIGHPAKPEFAIGAVSTFNRILKNYPKVTKEYIEQETENIQLLLQDRYQKYKGNRKPIDLKDKTVIVVDDGIATGNTIQVAIDQIKANHPSKIVIAVPVAHPLSLERLAPEVDEIICLLKPSNFKSISNFYEDFQQVSDQEVSRLLQQSWGKQ